MLIIATDHCLGIKKKVKEKSYLLPEDDKSTGSGSLLLSNLKMKKKREKRTLTLCCSPVHV